MSGVVISPTFQPINLSTHQPFNLSTYQPINLSTYQPINLSTYQPINLSTYQPISHPTPPQSHQSTYKPVALHRDANWGIPYAYCLNIYKMSVTRLKFTDKIPLLPTVLIYR